MAAKPDRQALQAAEGARGRCHRELPVVVVTDRNAWADKCVSSLAGLESVVERATWSAARYLNDIPAALVLDIVPAYPVKGRLCARWADRAWQLLCICTLAAEPGAARVATHLRSLGYSIFQLFPAEEAWKELTCRVRGILDSQAWIATGLARAVGCFDPRIVEAFHIALGIFPGRPSIKAWAAGLGLSRRQDLAAMFSARGLPRPKVLLDWLCLIRLIELATADGGNTTRDALAGKFGYSSGDYLGRRVRDLAGVPLGVLLEAGSGRALEIAGERLGAPRRGILSPVVSRQHREVVAVRSV